jgi:hypothetical protein
MNEMAIVNRAADGQRLKALVLDSVSSPSLEPVFQARIYVPFDGEQQAKITLQRFEALVKEFSQRDPTGV